MISPIDQGQNTKRPNDILDKDWGKYYVVGYYCKNCCHFFDVAIKKGITAPNVICPKCECVVIR